NRLRAIVEGSCLETLPGCSECACAPFCGADPWRVRQHLRLIDLLDSETKELGITGGEPNLLKDGLIEIVAKCKERLAQTALHISRTVGSFTTILREQARGDRPSRCDGQCADLFRFRHRARLCRAVARWIR